MKHVYVIICIIGIVLSPMTVKTNSKTNLPAYVINYHWFNTSGTYIRQNTLDNEASTTGFDNIPTSPCTLREKGYNPVNCYPGSPPVPIDPSLPDAVLYSHP